MTRAMRPLLILALLGGAPPAFCQQATITGTVVDTSGTFVAHAQITLSLEGGGPDRETQSTEAGDFSFSNVTPGPFHMTLTADGLAVKVIAGDLHAGETLNLPRTALAVAAFNAEVNVTPDEAEIAEAQIKVQEQQRIIGIIPNYFVNYDANAAPLNTKQKFELTWKGFVDPAAFVGIVINAAIGQVRNTNPGFGRGAQGYAKRSGAAYADFVTGRIIDKVVMPTVFKQDPRYFYKGTGSARSRAFYAISRSVMCRGDNKQAQVCYSSLISHFASASVTNFYYPPADRNSSRVILENAVIGIGGHAVGNLLQEFVARKLTRKKP
jgi:hypothetical protein